MAASGGEATAPRAEGAAADPGDAYGILPAWRQGLADLRSGVHGAARGDAGSAATGQQIHQLTAHAGAFRLVDNVGTGNCLAHTIAHGLGLTPCTERLPAPDVVCRIKAVLADGTVSVITGNRCRTLLAALATNETQHARDVRQFIKRATIFNMMERALGGSGDSGADARDTSTERTPWVRQHLAPAVRRISAWRESQPLTMFMVAAQQFHISVSVWQLTTAGGYALVNVGSEPAVFAPAGHPACRHVDVLFHACGYAGEVLGSRVVSATGVASTLTGNHYALMLPVAAAAEPLPFDLARSRGIRAWPDPSCIMGRPAAAAQAAMQRVTDGGQQRPEAARNGGATSQPPPSPPASNAGTKRRRVRRGSGTSRPAPSSGSVSRPSARTPQGDGGGGSSGGSAGDARPVAPRDPRNRLVAPDYDTIGDERLASALDDVSTDTLVETRFFTSAAALRSTAQQQQWRLLVEFATEQWKDGLYACVEATHGQHRGGGGRAAAVQAAELMAVRAYKFMHLLAPLVFAHLGDTCSMSVGDRLQAVLSGDIRALTASIMKAAHPSAARRTVRHAAERPASRGTVAANVAAPLPVTEPDMPWTLSDAALHDSCARLSGQRNGVGLAARRLEQREARAPADEATLAALCAKHPAAGTRTAAHVYDTEHADVRRLAAAARARRVQAMPTAAVTAAAARRSAASGAAEQDGGDGGERPAPEREWPPRGVVSEEQAEDGPQPPLALSADDIGSALRGAGAGKAGGLDGLRYEHLWVAVGTSATAAAAEDDHRFGYCPTDPNGVREHGCLVTKHLAAAYTVLLGAPDMMPEESWRLFRAAALTAVGEKRRPIAVSSVWRRLLGSAVAQKVKADLAAQMEDLSQFGFGVPSGVEHVATEARAWHEMGGIIVQLDCENAFNSVDRAAMVSGLEHYCPKLLPLFAALYCGDGPPELRVALRRDDGAETDGVSIVRAHLGCQQGDPLGPLWFAVAATFLLHKPGSGADDDDDDLPPPPPPPHCAFLDDLNLRLSPALDATAEEQVALVVRRLAAGGLRVRPDKCMAIAMRGRVFTDGERRRLDRLGIPCIDGTAPPARRGFTSVGVPIGQPEYVRSVLSAKLFDPAAWRFAWHLAGMARTELQAALRIFNGSLTKRFMYLARNVDPAVGGAHFGGFDGFCAWTFDRIMHLDGAAAAVAMQTFLRQACVAGDAALAASGGPLRLPGLVAKRLAWAPDQEALDELPVPALPLAVARLPEREGGRGLPQLHLVCHIAFAAQVRETLPARLLGIARAGAATSGAAGGLSFAARQSARDGSADAGLCVRGVTSDDAAPGGHGADSVPEGGGGSAPEDVADGDGGDSGAESDADIVMSMAGDYSASWQPPLAAGANGDGSDLDDGESEPRDGMAADADAASSHWSAGGLRQAFAPTWRSPLAPILESLRDSLRWLTVALPAPPDDDTPTDDDGDNPAQSSFAASTDMDVDDSSAAGCSGAAAATAAAANSGIGDEATAAAAASTPESTVQRLFPPALLAWAEADPAASVSLTGDVLQLLTTNSAPAPAEPSCASVRVAKATGRDSSAAAAAVDAAGDGNVDTARADSFSRGAGWIDPVAQSRKGPRSRFIHVQSALTADLLKRQATHLQDRLAELKERGRAALAQLRSQRGRGALSGLAAAPGMAPMHGMAVATVVLNALFVDAWGLQPRGDALCPYVGCKNERNHCGGPTTAHAMSCVYQHHRGKHATHTTQKRCLQRLLRAYNVPWFTNEDSSMFKVSNRKADTAVARGAMHMARDERLQRMGVIVDTTVRSPVADLYLRGTRKNSATTDGFAANLGDKQKQTHHKGCLDEQQWHFVPFVQETFGRLGDAAYKFLRELAAHSAACKGGDSVVIRRRAGIFLRRIVVCLNASLHAELAERVFAYVRGARQKGWVARPVSSHLHTITASVDDTSVPAALVAPPPP